MDTSGVVPAVNQIEMHPYFPQEELRAVHDSLGIRTVAWSPLAKAKALFEEEPVRAAAEAHGVSPGAGGAALALPARLGADPEVRGPRSTSSRTATSSASSSATTRSHAITALGREDGRLFDGDPNEHYEM